MSQKSMLRQALPTPLLQILSTSLAIPVSHMGRGPLLPARPPSSGLLVRDGRGLLALLVVRAPEPLRAHLGQLLRGQLIAAPFAAQQGSDVVNTHLVQLLSWGGS